MERAPQNYPQKCVNSKSPKIELDGFTKPGSPCHAGVSQVPGGVLNFELGMDVRPEDSTTTITKPEKTQICNLCLNHLFFEGPILKPISTFLPCKLGCMGTFWQPIGKPKEKFIEN